MNIYSFNDNSLVRSMDFNPCKIESIFTNGIVSKRRATLMGLNFSRNFDGYNLDDYVSLSRPLYSNIDDDNSAYYSYVNKRVNLIIENQDFLYDRKDNYFNMTDEVLVEGIVPKENFKGILINEELLDIRLDELPMINPKSKNASHIINTCNNLIDYMKGLNHDIDTLWYDDLVSELKATSTALYQDKTDVELRESFMDVKMEISAFLATEVQECFDSLLGKDGCTLGDMLNYINSKTLNLPMYKTSMEYYK